MAATVTFTLRRSHLVLGAALVALVAWWFTTDRAAAEDETYTAVTPCAIFDSRITQGGPGTLTGGVPWEVQITGAPSGQGATTGGCNIPATATAVQLNVVAINALTEGNLRIYEPGGTFNGGVVNYQSLTPKLNNSNAVIVPIAPCATAATERCVVIEPNAGSLGAVTTVEARGIALGYFDEGLATRVAELETLLAGLTRTTIDGLDSLVLTGANLHLRDGSGDTECDGGNFNTGALDTCNGLGNLILGYHANSSDTRTGTHGLVIGDRHSYASYGHLIAGHDNATSHRNATVTGGTTNTAAGDRAVVVGGANNSASGDRATVGGGNANSALGGFTSVTGGAGNQARGGFSAVTGGTTNLATGSFSTITGGQSNTTGGTASSVTGGRDNDATGDYATTSGGQNRDSSGTDDWRAGSLFEDF